jgi:UDP-N-acetylmuramyl pentapeptide phosphotransferase/UDP-N-acetylglucosamine-1-phosphate transferase
LVPVLPVLAAFLAALAVLWLLLTPLGRRLVLDRPNERSLHERPVPRTGGLAILAGIAAGAALAPSPPWNALGLAAALAAVSFLDDVVGLPTLVRLAAHLAAAAAVLALEFGTLGPVPVAVLALAIAWYANLYNFMDGSDGLAGGMAVIGFGAYAAASLAAGNAGLAALSAAIAAASAAFLAFNFPPARIFMGDAGSVPLGFLAGALGVLGWRSGAWPLWFPVLVFAPFVCDATLTLAKRLARRERVWRAHREHYYQRLVRMGHGHRGTAGIEYAAMAGCAAAALLARSGSIETQVLTLAAAAAGLAAIAVWVDARWARHLRRQATREC